MYYLTLHPEIEYCDTCGERLVDILDEYKVVPENAEYHEILVVYHEMLPDEASVTCAHCGRFVEAVDKT